MLGQLLPCGGGEPIPLLKPRLVVGRGDDCELRIPLKTISSRHCVLDLRDGAWHVTDLDSRNGVRVDGSRCREARLAPGCVLWIAQQRYQIEYAIKCESPVPARPRDVSGPHST